MKDHNYHDRSRGYTPLLNLFHRVRVQARRRVSPFFDFYLRQAKHKFSLGGFAIAGAHEMMMWPIRTPFRSTRTREILLIRSDKFLFSGDLLGWLYAQVNGHWLFLPKALMNSLPPACLRSSELPHITKKSLARVTAV